MKGLSPVLKLPPGTRGLPAHHQQSCNPNLNFFTRKMQPTLPPSCVSGGLAAHGKGQPLAPNSVCVASEGKVFDTSKDTTSAELTQIIPPTPSLL